MEHLKLSKKPDTRVANARLRGAAPKSDRSLSAPPAPRTGRFRWVDDNDRCSHGSSAIGDVMKTRTTFISSFFRLDTAKLASGLASVPGHSAMPRSLLRGSFTAGHDRDTVRYDVGYARKAKLLRHAAGGHLRTAPESLNSPSLHGGAEAFQWFSERQSYACGLRPNQPLRDARVCCFCRGFLLIHSSR